VEKIKSMVVIKRFGKGNSLMTKEPTRSDNTGTNSPSFSHNLTDASLPPTAATPLPPSTGTLFSFCSTSTSPHLNHPLSNFSLHRCRHFKPPLLNRFKKF